MTVELTGKQVSAALGILASLIGAGGFGQDYLDDVARREAVARASHVSESMQAGRTSLEALLLEEMPKRNAEITRLNVELALCKKASE